MKIKIIGSAIDRIAGPQFAASYLIDDRVAIDAGPLGLMSSVEDQRRITDIFVSHSHLDHLATLPLLLDNVYRLGPECPRIHASQFVRDCLTRDIFNERVWPDLLRLSSEESPFLRFCPLAPEQVVALGHLSITPCAVNHPVPTFGFIVEDEIAAVAFVSDTGPTERIWELLKQQDKLKGLFLEAAFPNSMQWLADKTGHLTPATFLGEYRKLGREIPVIAIHLKPAYHEEIVAELRALSIPQLVIGESNAVYEF